MIIAQFTTIFIYENIKKNFQACFVEIVYNNYSKKFVDQYFLVHAKAYIS